MKRVIANIKRLFPLSEKKGKKTTYPRHGGITAVSNATHCCGLLLCPFVFDADTLMLHTKHGIIIMRSCTAVLLYDQGFGN